MAIQAQALIAGDATQSSAVDNATATATIPATPGVIQRVLGVSADYSATVSSVKTITITAEKTVVFRWDFTNGAFHFALPMALRGDINTAITVALEASGSGGTTGRVTAWHFPN